MMACKNDISKAQTEAKQVNTDIKHYVIVFFFFFDVFIDIIKFKS